MFEQPDDMRPDSFAGCLDSVVEILDSLDQALFLLSELVPECGEPPRVPAIIRRDLKTIVANLGQHPEIDAEIMSWLT